MKPISANTVSLFALLAFGSILAGCSNPDSAIVGDWKPQKGTQTMSFKSDHTVSSGTGLTAMTGTWALKDKTVTIKIATIQGKPVADQKAEMDKQIAKIPAAMMTPDAKKQIDAAKQLLDTGIVETLSTDGKTMTTTIMNNTQTLTKVDAKS